MIKTLNKTILVGNLGKTPEFKQQGDVLLAELSLATHEVKSDGVGTYSQKTHWHKVTVFNEALLEHVVKHLEKGDCVYVTGPTRTNTWKDKNEVTRYDTYVSVSGGDNSIALIKKVSKNKDTNDN